MTKTIKLISTLLALTLVSTASQATIIETLSTSNYTTSGVSVSEAGTTTFINETPTFDKFDASLGTLTSATLAYDITGDINLFGGSYAPAPHGFAVGNIAFSYNGHSQVKNFDINSFGSVTMTGPDNIINLDLLDVTGVGTFDLGSFLAIYTMDQGMFLSGVLDTSTADIDFTLIYQYTQSDTSSVPEPGSLVIFSLALAGLGFSLRKAK